MYNTFRYHNKLTLYNPHVSEYDNVAVFVPLADSEFDFKIEIHPKKIILIFFFFK